jgi:hypothetical protein
MVCGGTSYLLGCLGWVWESVCGLPVTECVCALSSNGVVSVWLGIGLGVELTLWERVRKGTRDGSLEMEFTHGNFLRLPE